MKPGEIVTAAGELELNKDSERLVLDVANSGDRPIQVGSHYHFSETNSALKFDRQSALGRRLDIPAGSAIRFEPGQTREVVLVLFRGTKTIVGFNGHTMGQVDPAKKAGVRSDRKQKISRTSYAGMFGPTLGDKVRLADTELFIEVEKDFTTYGDEVKFGGGKVIRDGMGQSQVSRQDGSVDTVITNALILDWSGIIKADIGLKNGNITAIGKAGNPDIMSGVDIIIGPGTEVIAGEGKIITAGGLDVHIHFICPCLLYTSPSPRDS